jgi:hypothetical protein
MQPPQGKGTFPTSRPAEAYWLRATKTASSTVRGLDAAGTAGDLAATGAEDDGFGAEAATCSSSKNASIFFAQFIANS